MTKKTFGAKLYSMFLTSIGISLIIATICFLLYANYLTNGREKRNTQNILNSVSQNLELQFSDVTVMKKAFYNKTIFRMAESLNNPKLYENYDELFRIDMKELYEITMTKLLHTSSQIVRSVVMFPADGESQAYYLGLDTAELKVVDYPHYKQEEWYQKGYRAQKGTYYLAPHIPEYMPNKKLGEVYSCVSALTNMDSGKVIGVIKFDVDKKNLQEALNVIKTSKKNGLVLLEDDHVFAQSDSLGQIEEIGDRFILTDSGRYLFAEQEVPGTDLVVAYLYPPSQIYMNFVFIIVMCIGIPSIGFVLAFAYYRYHAKQMVSDVQKITEVIRKVEQGELDTYIKIENSSELGEIAVAINRMIDNLKEYIEKEYLLVIQQKKAEYRALQSQIHPHFLYNTLNGFVALNRMGDKRTLEKSIIGLSKLFRYTCSRLETVPVHREFEFLEEYLKLEKLKYEERLEYLILLDPECANFEIPRLILQPVAENCIKHGMGDSEEPILIQIAALSAQVRGIGRIMMLTVQDDGVGFDSTRTDKSAQGIGEENVRIRAQLYCKDAVYQCISLPGKGTKTTFIFPCDRQG